MGFAREAKSWAPAHDSLILENGASLFCLSVSRQDAYDTLTRKTLARIFVTDSYV